DTIFKALAPAIPERVIAGHHADLLSAAINGNLPDDKGLFLLAGGLVGGGWGARRGADGSNATICINDGDTHNSPIEQVEAKYPMIIERYGLRPDSGGAGTWRGGLGTEKVVRAVHEFMFNAQVDRVHCRPWGLFDELSGAGNQVAVQRGDLPEESFPSGKVLARLLKPGDAYILRSGGGGGYGSPLDRELAAIDADLAEGYISAQRAAAVYGVVVAPDGRSLDMAASLGRRAALRAAGWEPEEADDEDATAADEDAGRPLQLAAGILPQRCC